MLASNWASGVRQVDYSCNRHSGSILPQILLQPRARWCSSQPAARRLGSPLIRRALLDFLCPVAQYSDDAFAFRSFKAQRPYSAIGDGRPSDLVGQGALRSLPNLQGPLVRATGQQYAARKVNSTCCLVLITTLGSSSWAARRIACYTL